LVHKVPAALRTDLGWRGVLALVAIALVSTATAQTGTPPQRPPGVFESEVLRSINARRDAAGLGALQNADDLKLIASEHSQHMAQLGRVSHEGFAQRFSRTTGTVCVENLAAGFTRPEALVDAWLASPAHGKNLIEPRVWRVGIAASGRYITFFACD
jgi:uncharacterized protein YkwD